VDIISRTQNETDENLVDLVKQGDQAAFSRMMERYRPFVGQVVGRFCFREEDSRDLVQDTFIRIWKGIGQFDGKSAFTSWIYRIAFNLCLDHMRVLGRRKEIPFPEGFVPEVAVAEGDATNDFARIVKGLARKLSKTQRLVFVLRDMHDLPVEEVCRITSLQPDQVKANLYHARKFMREKLEKGGYL
jgi:RNA polymerase sigma-70 factor, ECF subfamily